MPFRRNRNTFRPRLTQLGRLDLAGFAIKLCRMMRVVLNNQVAILVKDANEKRALLYNDLGTGNICQGYLGGCLGDLDSRGFSIVPVIDRV